jgi:hypothetical protein
LKVVRFALSYSSGVTIIWSVSPRLRQPASL